MPRVAVAMHAFFVLTKKDNKRGTMRWTIAHDEETCVWMASTRTQWLQTVFEASGNNPPKGFNWTSHNLRKRAASTANVIKVPLNDIRYSGGWSTNSTVLEAKYIDFAMAPSNAAYIFFGHIARDKPLDA